MLVRLDKNIRFLRARVILGRSAFFVRYTGTGHRNSPAIYSKKLAFMQGQKCAGKNVNFNRIFRLTCFFLVNSFEERIATP
jgi:hypothetical protein